MKQTGGEGMVQVGRVSGLYTGLKGRGGEGKEGV